MRAIHTFINQFFLVGAVLLLVLTVISGTTNNSSLRNFYWLRADTSGIPNAPADLSVWTFWGVCDKNNFHECVLGPAFPILPQDNFRTTENIPEDFLENRNTYFYLSRFAFAFAIMTLAFAGLALIVEFLAYCFELIDRIVIFLITLAVFFMAGFASFITAVVVLARNAFKNGGRQANVNATLLGVTWAAFVCLLICWVLTFASNIAQSYRHHMERVNGNQADDAAPIGDDSSFTRASPPEPKDTDEHTGGIRFFKIKRNQKVSDDESV
ncbi:Protein SUR7 [Spathaspora sp. JA1]|nr:Protein SUR7 [Spathaspora sp. JA1]